MITKEYLLMAIVTSLMVVFLITGEQPVTTEIIMRLIKILFSL